MKRKKWWEGLACAGLVMVVAAGAALAAGNQGSQENPLVTLSYLNDVALPAIMEQVDQKVAQRSQELEEQFRKGGGASFQTVELGEERTLTLAGGSQFLLRSGTLRSADALVDLTTGETRTAAGELTANHLYLATGDGQKITASADCLLLVQGSYEE